MIDKSNQFKTRVAILTDSAHFDGSDNSWLGTRLSGTLPGAVSALIALSALLLFTTTAQAAGVVGNGTPASCTGNALQTALNGGGFVSFDCGNVFHNIIANTYVISQDTVIDGDETIGLDGEDLRQLFIVQSGATLELRNLTLREGNFADGGCVYVESNATLIARNTWFSGCESPGTGDGGAIYSLGTVISDNAKFVNGKAGDDGGAIFALGTVYVNDTFFANNQAASGGAIRLNGGQLSVERSTFDANTATATGGAIDIATGSVAITNTTIYRNLAPQGGGIYSAGGSTDTSVTASTLFANRADTGGGLFYFGNGAFTLQSSIVAASLESSTNSPALECDGPSITSLGYNLIGDNSCFGGTATDIKDIDASGGAKLTPFSDNDVPILALIPDTDSPAVDTIPSSVCEQVDQFGAQRSAPCDIGSVELGALLPTLYLPITIQ